MDYRIYSGFDQMRSCCDDVSTILEVRYCMMGRKTGVNKLGSAISDLSHSSLLFLTAAVTVHVHIFLNLLYSNVIVVLTVIVTVTRERVQVTWTVSNRVGWKAATHDPSPYPSISDRYRP